MPHLNKSVNIRFKTKPWINAALQKSVSIKNDLLKNKSS